MAHRHPGRTYLLLALIALLFIPPAVPARLAAAVQASSPAPFAGGVRAAWENALAAGSYRSVTDIEETLIPQAVPENIGVTEQRLDLRVDADVRLPDQALLRLSAESGTDAAAPVSLVVADGQAFVERQGALQPSADPTGLGLPGADSLAFLSAARNERQTGTREAGSGTFAVYAFDFDGSQYARYLTQALEARLAAESAPDGITAQVPDRFSRLTGAGELWVDAEGLPRRMTLDLSMPGAADGYDAAIRVVVDLRDFGQVGAIPRPEPDGQGGWRLAQLPASGSAAGSGAASGLTRVLVATPAPFELPPSTAALLIACLFAALLIARPRRFAGRLYRIIAWTVILSMLLSPILQPMGVRLYTERKAEAAEATANPLAEAFGVTDSPVSQADLDRLQRPENGFDPSAPDAASALTVCGDGEAAVDSDHDGLTDQQENCLGTDAYAPDTDGDGITDTLEIEGFEWPVASGHFWYGDPFKADSNGDSVPDLGEWPTPAGIAPQIDTDGDDVPNLWDDDDDGDDVPDWKDLSILSSSIVSTTFSLETQGGGYDGFEYIQIQVQPEEESHWRYSLSPLDWPNDEEGQITDLNGSTEDLRLIPMLEIETNVKPDGALNEHYGVIPASKLYIPLYPESDGGRITSFYGKVAYAPSQLDDIQWSSIRFLWAVYGTVDAYVCHTVGAGTACSMRKDSSILNYYVERYRLTGLSVVASGEFETAVFGTPSMPTEDAQLFKLAMGMSGPLFTQERLEGQDDSQTALQEIQERFNTSSPITYTFGVTTPVASSRAIYPHIDEGVSELGSRVIPDFLNANFPDSVYSGGRCRDAASNQFVCASLVVATEYRTGSFDLGELGARPVSTTFAVNLAAFDMALIRSVRLNMYEKHAGKWDDVDAPRLVEIVMARYAGSWETTVETLRARYRGVTVDAAQALLIGIYASWATGQTHTLSINGIAPLNADLVAANSAAAGQALLKVLAVDSVYLVLCLIGDIAGIKAFDGYAGDWGGLGRMNLSTLSGRVELAALGIFGAVVVVGQMILGAMKLACAITNDELAVCQNKMALKIAGLAFSTLSSVVSVLVAVQAMGCAINAMNELVMKTGEIVFKWIALNTKLCIVLAVIGLIIDVIMIWVVFGLTVGLNQPNPQIIGPAVATAVVATAWAVVMFILALIVPIGSIIAAILSVLDLLISIITYCFGLDWSISRILTEMFYSNKTTTVVDSINYLGMQADFANPDNGPVVGNVYHIEDTFRGTIVMSNTLHQDFRDDFQRSWVESHFEGATVPGSGGAGTDVSGERDCHTLPYDINTWECTNTVGMDFELYLAQPNLVISLTRVINMATTYRDCGLWGTVCEISHVVEREIRLPDLTNDNTDDDEYLTLPVDVLPASPDGFWSMPGVTIADRDGDGVPDVDEPGFENNPDRDGDDLTDGFEIQNAAALGFDVNLADTDGDGLHDGLEYHLATRADNPDTDGDGLPDGQEIFHQNLDDTFSGGWTVTLPGGTTALVSSDPKLAYTDDDPFQDGAEYERAISPYAINSGPRLTLSGDPLDGAAGGRMGFYATPGRQVTLTLALQNIGTLPVTQTLALCLPAAVLGSPSGGVMQGSRTPPRTTGSCAAPGPAWLWNFTGEYTLQVFEAVTTTVVATVPAGAASGRYLIVATLPYEGDTLSAYTTLIVDDDNPDVTLDLPPDGAYLAGTTYDMSGSASDPTGWVERVQVDTGSGWVDATGTDAWIQRWNLPSDGAYTLRARAVDGFAHVSAERAVQVNVDNTPPTVTLTVAGSYVTALTSTIRLAGTSSDNLGVERVQLSIDGRAWRTVSQAGGAWGYDWIFGGEAAQGTHDVSVRVADLAGNFSDQLNAVITVDVLPPVDEVTSGRLSSQITYLPSTTGTTFYGYANDAGRAPLPSRPVPLEGTLDALDDATARVGPDHVADQDDGVKPVWLGDINDDGRADLAVGLPAAENGAGRVAILYGKGGGWAVPPTTEELAASPATYVGAAGAGIGALLAPAGDVNGDGFDDFLIGDPANGRAFLIFGRVRPLGQSIVLDGVYPNSRQIIEVPGLQAVAPAGDVNGDGFDDLLVSSAGETYLLVGHTNGWPESVTTSGLAARVPAGGARAAIGVGDVNGDRLDDFAVRVPGTGVYLFGGRTTFVEKANIGLLLQVDAANAFALLPGDGLAITPLGDVNGDGLSDFIHSNGSAPRLVLGRQTGAWNHSLEFNAYTPAPNGWLAAPGDVNADGLDDILLGVASNHSAYLTLGSASIAGAMPAIQATLTGVSGAASARYAAGADANCDDSSDLLLVPYTAAGVTPLGPFVDFGGVPYINPETLPAAPDTPAAGRGADAPLGPLATVRYVDDDYCAACANDGHTWNTDAFQTIQSAVNAAAAGDTIVVNPGVYRESITISKNNLTLDGVNPDAVFIDAGGATAAVSISSATGVRLVDLTVRNAQRGVSLENAGAGGNVTPANKIRIEHSAFYSFTNALYMDRISTASVVSTTLAGQAASGAYVYVTSAADPSLARTWTADPVVPGALNTGSDLAVAGSTIYALAGQSTSLYAYTSGTWATRTLPATFGQGSALAAQGGTLYALRGENFGGGVNGPVYALARDASGNLYVGGSFSSVQQPDGTSLNARNIAMWNGTGWSNLSNGTDGIVYALLANGSDIYVGGQFTIAGAVSASNIARLNGGVWYALGAGTNGRVQALALSGSTVYVGGMFSTAGGAYRPSLAAVTSAGTWSTPWTPATWSGPVIALAVNGATLAAGGSFTLANGVSANRVAIWNGSAWTAAGAGITCAGTQQCKVTALAYTSSGTLYAGGYFSTAGTVSAANVASYAGSTWSALGTGTNGPVYVLVPNPGGGIYVGGAFTEYSGWTGSRHLAFYLGGWSRHEIAPGRRGAEGSLVVHAALYDSATGDLFVGGRFNMAGGDADGGVTAGNVARAGTSYKSTNGGIDWSPWIMSANMPAVLGPGAALAGDGSTKLYATRGGGSKDFLLYTAGLNTWSRLAALPVSIGAGGALAYTGDVYALRGGATGEFYRYVTADDHWVSAAGIPCTVSEGGSLAWDGRDYLYALCGNGSAAMYRYRLSTNAWETAGNAGGSALNTVSRGGALARSGNMLYATRGGGNTAMFHYGPVGISAEKLTLDRVLFAGPSTASASSWLNLTGVQQSDFEVGGSDSMWTGGGTWSPAQFSTWSSATIIAVPLSSVAFADPIHDVYRLTADSSLAAGYSLPHDDAYVSTAYCSSCANDGRVWGVTAFSSIQSAIDSGANKIYILPGTYELATYMVQGLSLIGVGAERVVIQPPAAGSPSALLKAEGIAGIEVSRMTLDGQGRTAGLRVEDGAFSVLSSRNIIRGTTTAVSLQGSGTVVEIANNTLDDNTNGIVARDCASIDVRNTIFTGHAGAALDYESCAATRLHRYNLYFGNADDFRVDGVAAGEPGPGELFQDPLYRDSAAFDFRLLPGSPAIDAGSPSDPTPPGAGGRADIGYAEWAEAAFYVDDDYCPLCENDGLEWGVNAFSTIQSAVDAAAAQVRLLPGLRPTVGVAAGMYYEHVQMRSYVRLAGVGADEVTIQASGGGSPVTFSGVTHAEVTGFTLRGAGFLNAGITATNSANHITATHNLIFGNYAGASVGNWATLVLRFNTFVGNTTGLACAGFCWIDARDNIVAYNTFGVWPQGGGSILGDYNLVYGNTTDYVGATPGAHDIRRDPLFIDRAAGDYHLQSSSPAIDAAEPASPVPPGGGRNADLGYAEAIAAPLTLLFGREGTSCAVGNSGVQSVEIGLAHVITASLPVTATLPTTWSAATLDTPGDTASRWSSSIVPGTAGFYRLYTRAADQAGNQEADPLDWYSGAFVADSAAPAVAWVSPAGGTTTAEAAIEMIAEVSDYVSGPDGPEFSVSDVYFMAGTATTKYYADWDDTGWTGSGPRRFHAMVPLSDGANSITAYAVDKAGQTGSTEARTINATTTAAAATTTSLWSNAQVHESTLLVSGYARYPNTTGAGWVNVQVDSNPPVSAIVDNQSALLTSWSVTVTLSAGTHTILATAGRGGKAPTGATRVPENSVSVVLDNAAPTLVVNTPAAGAVLTKTVIFAGTAADTGSTSAGVTGVSVSLDGSSTWQDASLAGGNWSLTWTAPQSEPYVYYIANFRATDKAGNQTVVTRTFTIDNSPPAGIAPVTFSLPEGTHLDASATLVFTWTAPIDAHTITTTLLAVDQSPSTIPTVAVSGTSYSASLNATGDWYVHLSARDGAGNRADRHYGPWHVGSFANTGLACASRRQTILLDGYLDVAHDEWRATAERLDDDERGGDMQELYATWDGAYFYLGWQGARWPTDGTLWVYLDTAAGGSATARTGQSLPFQADYAVAVSSSVTGTLYAYTGGAWTAQGTASFAHSAIRGTEIRIPWSAPAVTNARLIAFALGRDGAPWSVFPTTNPLGGPWTANYLWASPCTVTDPADNQPVGKDITLDFTSPQSTLAPSGPDGTLQYALAVTNDEAEGQSGVQITVTTTTGLAFQSAAGSGYTCTTCAPGTGNWTISLDPLAAGETRLITVTGQLAASLTGLSAVTTTAGLSQPPLALATMQLAHRLDSRVPQAWFLTNPEITLRPGMQDIQGNASDGDGGGVDYVELRQAGGTWNVVSGTLGWTGTFNVPAVATLVLEARAVDVFGQIGTASVVTFTVDTTPPTLQFAPPAVITTTFTGLEGTVYDPSPTAGAIDGVQVQFDSESTWSQAQSLFAPNPDGSQDWAYGWPLPAEDGVTHQVRARAFDAAGNVVTSTWHSTIVDTVAPVVTMTAVLTRVSAAGYPPFGTSGGPVLVGTVSDGSGVGGIDIRVDRPDGASATTAITVTGGSFSFTPSGLMAGLYRHYVIARDARGNTRTLGAFDLLVQEQAIAGLAASSNSPVTFGQPAAFTATITAGTNVTYTWTFGDGTSGSGANPAHTYLASGVYTATVTAANTVSSMSASTVVRVMRPVSGLSATSSSPTALGSATRFTATLASGDFVNYAWSFGDHTAGSGATTTHTYAAAGTYTAAVTATNSLNQQSTSTTVYVVVPVSGLTAANSSPTRFGQATAFTATLASGGGTVTYAWAFGDGTTGLGATTTHTYAAAGTYTAVVTATNSVGSSSATTAVQVIVPVSGLTAANSSPTLLGRATAFTATLAAGGGVTYAWSFGDGTTGSGATAAHTYAAAGTYTAVVTATNAINSMSTSTVVHIELPVRDLVVTNDGPTALRRATTLSATAVASSTVTYEWTFGDGATGSGAPVTHDYPAAGVYTATVTARSDVSTVTGSTIVVVELSIGELFYEDFHREVFPPPGWAPYGEPGSQPWQRTTAQAHSAPYSMYHNDDTGAQDAWMIMPPITPTEDSALVFWQYENYHLHYTYHGIWVSTGSPDPREGDFVELAALGPGIEDTWQQVQVALDAYAGRPIYLAFRYQGDYSDEWYVDDVAVIGYLVAANDGPTALGQPTTFTATVPVGTNLAYAWDFGDGATGAGAVVTHTYGATGAYTAVVTATNSVSRMTATTTAQVQRVVSGLSATSSSPTALGSTTAFTATLAAGGDGVTYAWSFGDGATGSGATAAHTYAAAGTYTAVVTATNGVSQLSAGTSVLVVVPVSGLTAANSSPTLLGGATAFTATLAAGGGAVTYAWTFGDGTSGSGATAAHTYAAAGMYTAVVTASNAVSSIWTSTVVHIELPVRDLVVVNDGPTALGWATTLSATAVASSTITYAWTFGDGATGSGALVTHVYPAVGVYTATVTARSNVSTAAGSTAVVVDVPIAPFLFEDFDGPAFPPAGWTPYGVPGSQPWQRTTAQAHSAPYSMYHDDDYGPQDAWMITPRITPSAGSALIFWQYENYHLYYTYHGIWVSTGSPDPRDGNYVELAALGPGSEDTWQQVQVALDAYAGRPIYLAFRYRGDYSDEWYVDDVVVTAPVAVTSDSPTYHSLPTTFTATVASGTNVIYTWDFGDGTAGAGSVVSHVYPAPGGYTATVTATNSLGLFSTGTAAVTIVPAVDLHLDKSGPAAAIAGTQMTYTLRVDNPGPSNASALVVVDDLPGELAFVAATPGCSHAGAHVTCAIAALPAGGTTTVEIVTFVDPAARGVLTNTAQVTAAEHEFDPADNVSTQVTSLGTAVDLEVELAAPDPVAAGETFTYTLHAVNAGPSTEFAAVLTATLPAGAAFVSITPGCAHGGQAITCTLGLFPAGAERTYQLAASVAPEVRGTLVAEAHVAGFEPETHPADNAAALAVTVVGRVDLVASLGAVPDPATAGEMLTYTLAVTNTGPSQATGVVLAGALPAGTTLVAASPGCGLAGGTVTCTLPALMPAAGAEAGLVVAIDPSARGALTYTVAASSTELEVQPADNTATVVVALEARADLALGLDGAPDPVLAGEGLTYTLALSNLGPSQSDGATVTGTLPAGVSFIDAAPGCAHAGGVITCTIGALAPAGQALAEVHVAVAPEVRGTLTYTVHVAGVLPDPQAANDTATITTTVAGQADLSLGLSAPPMVIAGTGLTYTLAVTNTGPSLATGVGVELAFPPEVTVLPAPGCTITGSLVVCEFGDVLPGVMHTQALSATVSPAATGTLTTTGVVAGAEPDPFTGDNEAIAVVDVVVPADLSVSLAAGPDPAAAGGLLTYTVTVVNHGPARATQIMITDTLPSAITFVSPSAGCSYVAGVVICTAGALDPQQELVFTIVVRLDLLTPGPIVNTVSVASAVPDLVVANNTATVVTGKRFTAYLPIVARNWGAGK